MKTIAISIGESALLKLDRLAARTNGKRLNRSEVIRRAVEEYISRLEDRRKEEQDEQVIRRHYKKFNRQAAALIREQARL